MEHGYWTLGFDRRQLLVQMLKFQMAFLVRQRGDRHIRTADGQELSIQQRATQIYQHEFPERWPFHGWIHTETVFLPEAPDHELLLVLFRRQPNCCPLMLLVRPQARRPGRTGIWFVRAYRRRWGVEDATWAIKQRFHLEQFLFLVRSGQSIRRLTHLVALAFFGLNLWGQDSYRSLRDAFLSHPPWRLPKKVIYLFDWLATQISQFLHPRPQILTTATSTLGELQFNIIVDIAVWHDYHLTQSHECLSENRHRDTYRHRRIAL